MSMRFMARRPVGKASPHIWLVGFDLSFPVSVSCRATLRHFKSPTDNPRLLRRIGLAPGHREGRQTWPSAVGATGASLNASYKVDEKTGLVSQFDIGMSDWDLGRYDESAAYAARLKAEQQAALKKEEGNESNVVKF